MDPESAKSSDFVVRLDGLQLDEAAKARIGGAIQGAVMSELARVDTGGRGIAEEYLTYFPRRDWYGFILRRMRDVQKIEDLRLNLQVGVKR